MRIPHWARQTSKFHASAWGAWDLAIPQLVAEFTETAARITGLPKETIFVWLC